MKNCFGKRLLSVLLFGIIGFTLPVIYGFIEGYPTPHIHDEFAYLVGADTFAEGRLTNPTPRFWQHFESAHLLLVPSYASKYPPVQSLFLATGQILFGHPVFGVWLSCGFAAATLFWMLLGWTEYKWAVAGTVLMILLTGISSYWAQSFWGGMAAVTGGALFFGGFRRLFNNFSYKATIPMMAGGVILVNSRPFEGFVMMLPALLVLLVKLLFDKKETFRKKFSQIVLPALLVTGIALSGMLYYNFRVTGSAFNLPYSEHQKQYYPTPLFIFQQRDESAVNGIEHVRKVYDGYTSPGVLTYIYQSFGIPSSLYLRPFLAFTLLIFFVPYFLMSPPLAMIFYVTVPVISIKDKWSALMTLTVLFTFACMSLATWWDNYHYSAPLTCCFYLLLINGVCHFVENYKEQKAGSSKFTLYFLLSALTLASIAYSQIFPSVTSPSGSGTKIDGNQIIEQISAGKPVKINFRKRATFYRTNIENALEKLDGKFLVLVFYTKNSDFNEEFVYNRADIENSKIIWAHDLGEEKNIDLLNYYNNRKILRLTISSSEIEIIPE